MSYRQKSKRTYHWKIVPQPRGFYVYSPKRELVICGHVDSKEAVDHAISHSKQMGENLFTLARDDERIKEYARTHPAFAKREGFGKRGEPY